MRPQSELTQSIHEWIAQSEGWFSHFRIDSALHIESSKEKTLRRVTLKRMCDKGELIRADDRQGVYKKFTPLKEIIWDKTQCNALS